MSNGAGGSRPILAAPGEAPDVAAAARQAAQRERAVAGAHRPRDYLLRRALAGADLLAVLAAAALALMLSPDPADPVDILWLLPTLPVWLVLFRLYGLYERDVKRVNASALDDLPSLFHAFVVGTLILWAYLRVFEGHGALTLVETIVFGALRRADGNDPSGRRPAGRDPLRRPEPGAAGRAVPGHRGA